MYTDQHSTTYDKVQKPACEDFASGRCRRSADTCYGDHDQALDPSLVGNRAPFDYMVDNELYQACEPCLSAFRICDKKGRIGDSTDPCSECRHFGGPGSTRQCQLVASSYNDRLWQALMDMAPFRYIMGPPKSRTDAKKVKGKHGEPDTYITPGAMPNVRPDWRGLSRADVLAQPSILPDGVRQWPRAFLVPGRLSNTRQKGTKRVAEHGRHDDESFPQAVRYSSGASSTLPNSSTLSRPSTQPTRPEEFDRPPNHPDWGPVSNMFIDFVNGRVHYVYQNSAQMEFPISIRERNTASSAPSQPPYSRMAPSQRGHVVRNPPRQHQQATQDTAFSTPANLSRYDTRGVTKPPPRAPDPRAFTFTPAMASASHGQSRQRQPVTQSVPAPSSAAASQSWTATGAGATDLDDGNDSDKEVIDG
ncbi:hypothetical protein D6C98_09545 [Aureobasidium pullulans]|nr:hypothetical protein D6C98_09545 [Aureobasidium pullulans]